MKKAAMSFCPPTEDPTGPHRSDAVVSYDEYHYRNARTEKVTKLPGIAITVDRVMMPVDAMHFAKLILSVAEEAAREILPEVMP